MNNDDIANSLKQAVAVLKAGGIIAYPTEAVYGLGCDPFNEQAVQKLLNLKKRPEEKGLILITHSWDAVSHLTEKIPSEVLLKVLKTWPGPYTWVFPAKLNLVPEWIRGKHNSVAIRITSHKITKNICENFGKPIVSTSANIDGQKETHTKAEVLSQFPSGIDYIIEGDTDNLKKPTPIYDVLTGKALRT